MLNVGIIGLGHVAEHQIAALRISRELRLIAGCDSDPSHFKLLDSSVDAYANLDEMLERPDLDVVIVATPNKLHVEHGIRVMEAGKWLVVEKPVAESQRNFDLLVDHKEKYKGHCTVALHAAFGVEVIWFHSEIMSGDLDLNRFDTFRCQFYDPYCSDGIMRPGALSLGGSWMDSGINALSVICKTMDPTSLVISDSRMMKASESQCFELEGTVDFDVSDPSFCGRGSIDTNWTIGLDRKTTRFGMSEGSQGLILDHSAQAVIRSDQGRRHVLFSCENDLPRLTNHYIGVFEDLVQQIRSGQDNIDYGQELHRLLYQAEYWPV
jgi:D-galactose 1-dehydrogenase